MTSPTLLSLAGRVESLTGPCRETDVAIYRVLAYATPGEHPTNYDKALPYTASLDAAMTLKPEGYSYALGDLNEANFPWACVTDPNGVDYTCLEDAATPPLVLLSALLRAIAAAGSAQ